MDLIRLKMLAAQENDAVEEAIQGALKAVWTHLPAIISEDSDGHTAKAQSAVKLAITQLDGTVKTTSFPQFEDAPVHYPNGGGHHFTHPVKKDDEGVVSFMSRAQDLWHQMGGEQDPVDNRAHHLADSRWQPGGRSDPRKLDPAPSSASAQHRSDDGSHVVDVNKDSGVTHSSTQKVLSNTGGANGSGTIHLPDSILKNAPKVMINTATAPNFPPPGATIANAQMVAGTPIGAVTPQIASMLAGVLSGGIGSILSSPIAAPAASLMTALSVGAASISSVLGTGGAAIVDAITGTGGLTDALASLQAGASALAGATAPAVGAYGLADLLSHAQQLTYFFGATPPPNVGLDAALAPLQSASTIADTQAWFIDLAAKILAGYNRASALSAINAHTAQLNAIMGGANAAIGLLQEAAPALSLALAAASAGVSLDPAQQAVAGALGGPGLAALTGAMAAYLEPSVSDLASIAAFPPAVAQPGAKGGFS